MSDCGKKWAKNDPDGLIKAINGNENTAALVNKAGPGKLKEFMRALGRDAVHPFGWIGGEVLFSAMFSAAEVAEGKTPLEALDSGLLWFLPKGVIDAHKKALFGYEGAGPAKAFKMKGYAGAYSQDQISDMKNYLDMEDADRKYWEAKDEKAAFEKKIKENPELFNQITSQIENNIARLDSNIKEYRKASTDAVRKIYETNTGLRTDGTPRYEDMYMEDLQAHMAQTGDNLWDVQEQYAIDQINRAKEGDVNVLYAQKEDPWDIFSKGTHWAGWTEKGQLPWGMGERGRYSTAITDPYDLWHARSPVPHYEKLPPGIKQIWNKYIDTYNLLPHASQEEKEAYARSIGRDDLLHKEYKHPIYGSSFSYDQIKRVFPDYFSGAGGGIAGIRRPWAIPPESGPDPQGLASLNNYATKRTE